MLTVDHYGRIRRAHRDGMSICEIARRFHHSRRKVREVLRGDGEPKAYPRRKRQHYRTLAAYLERIDEILASDEQAPPKQRHTMMQVFRRLRGEGYQGGYDAVRRYIRKRRKRQRETFIPLSHDPGQRLEADFGQIYVDFPEGRRAVSVLILVWSYSNCPFAIALPTERVEAILEGMVQGFEYFGCIPREVWWDNPKTVALKLLVGRDRQVHPRYAALASHYVFEPLFCMPARGNEKPCVETRVKTLQRWWSTPVPQVRDLNELNAYLLACCQNDRNRQRHGTAQTIGECFARDREAAAPLPPRPFDPCVSQPAKVDKYQLARFDNVCYSAGRACAFEAVTIKGYVDRVEIVHRGCVVAVHSRSYEPGEVLDPLHYLVTLERRPAALEHSNVYRNWKLPAVFAEIRERLERRHGSRPGVRQYIRVLQLLAEHPLERVRYVLERVCGEHELDADWIMRRVAERADREAGNPSPQALDGQRPEVMQVDVPVPDLTRYDRFLLHGDENDESGEWCSVGSEPEAVASSDDAGRMREAGEGGGRVESAVHGVPVAADRAGTGGEVVQCVGLANPPGVVSDGEGTRQLRLLGIAVVEQAEDPGTLALPVDRGAFELLLPGRAGHGQNAPCRGVGAGRVSPGLQSAVRHGGRVGQPPGGGAEAVPTGACAGPIGSDRPC